MGNVDNGTRDNTDSSKNYGKVKEDVSESNLLTHKWTAATTETWAYSSAPGAENRKLLCSFYTAERLFKSDYSDRLSISMANVPKALRTSPVSPTHVEILHMSNTGRVYTLIVRVNPERAKAILEATHPMLIDILPLTLEEIFIYEMGGKNYEIKDILF